MCVLLLLLSSTSMFGFILHIRILCFTVNSHHSYVLFVYCCTVVLSSLSSFYFFACFVFVCRCWQNKLLKLGDIPFITVVFEMWCSQGFRRDAQTRSQTHTRTDTLEKEMPPCLKMKMKRTSRAKNVATLSMVRNMTRS